VAEYPTMKEVSKQMKRYYMLRSKVLSILGNKCVKCGSCKKLEIDHINKDQKSADVAKIFNLSFKRIMDEAIKCQLLCRTCHIKKTILERNKKIAKGNHGTISSYRYCKCNLCKKAKYEHTKNYYKTHKRIMINGRRKIIKI
jgi:hypothetical protein